MTRMGMVLGIRPEHIAEYKRLHTAVWPDILAALSAAHISNYSIYLREPENLLFSYWEYGGGDFARDMATLATDEVTKRWWTLCSPLQVPLESHAKGEWWAMMEEVFHHD